MRYNRCRSCLHCKIGHATNNIAREQYICELRPKHTDRKRTDMQLYYTVGYSQKACDKYESKCYSKN